MRKFGSVLVLMLLMGLSGCNPAASDAQSVAVSHAVTDDPKLFPLLNGALRPLGPKTSPV
ncbi:hypothetical protein LFREDSHE_38310 [Shewanella baltica]